MTASQRFIEPSTLSAGFPDMEWQTPAVSDKFQSRFGRRPRTGDSSGDNTGLCVIASDSSEDFCGSRSSSSSFQPIRSQIPIPTAHVMPSTAGAPASKPHQPRPLQDEAPPSSSSAAGESHRSSSGSRTSSGASSKSSLSKSASSPNLDAQDAIVSSSSGGGAKPDCLSRYRSLVNGLDHSLFPAGGEHSRLDEGQRFDTPAVEPTLNQSALLLGGFGPPDVRFHHQMTGPAYGAADAYRGGGGVVEHTYKALPEARGSGGGPGGPEACGGQRGVGVYPAPLGLLAGAQAYEPLLGGERGGGGGGGGEPPGWQQQQQQQKQLESLRLQVEQLQMMTVGGVQYSSVYPPSLLPEPGKWDSVVKANESLLKEKELVIDRQKQQLAQLEQRLRDSELQVHGALLGRGGGAPYADVCLLRLQEAQRENAFLRAQFAERSDGAALEKAESERRLGSVEAESRRLNDALREAGEKHADDMKKQEERIRGRDKHINSLKKKCQKEAEQNRERQQRIETLERYLADLPTLEDYQSQNKQLQEGEQRAGLLQGRVRELEVCVEEARSHTREKDAQLDEQRRRERELLTTVTSLQQRVEEGLEDGVRLPSLDVEKLRGDNGLLREEQLRLKKVIEKQLRMMEQLGSQIRRLEEQACEEDSSSQALREEVESKEQSLLQLRTAVKELSAQNQELLEQNLTLQERQDYPALPSDRDSAPPRPAAAARLTQRLHGEMACCLGDLRSLCNVLTQRAQGRDPNLSLLLGITSPTPCADPVEDWLSPEVLQIKLSEAQQLRRDVEDLRTTVSDRYAQDMGENCITQ